MANEKSVGSTKGTIQSAEQAVAILKALTEVPGPMTLTALAQAVGMPTAKAHRYLTSLINTGLVTQSHRSGSYDLGNFALELGLAALSRQSQINRAADAMEELAQSSKATVLLAIWGNQGPTIIRWERAENYLVTSLGLGSNVPLLTSASGHVFLAYLPKALSRPIVHKERDLAKRTGITDQVAMDNDQLDQLIARIRGPGYANVDGGFIPGLAALSAPVLNVQGEIEANLTLISTNVDLLRPHASAFDRLMETCRALSHPQMR